MRPSISQICAAGGQDGSKLQKNFTPFFKKGHLLGGAPKITSSIGRHIGGEALQTQKIPDNKVNGCWIFKPFAIP
jgi:hypothetical protein